MKIVVDDAYESFLINKIMKMLPGIEIEKIRLEAVNIFCIDTKNADYFFADIQHFKGDFDTLARIMDYKIRITDHYGNTVAESNFFD